jgi:acetyltransferase-like isoleucine patch superfamily enzyme
VSRFRDVARTVADRTRSARLWRATERALVPPPRSAFAECGSDVLLVAPVRIEGPEFMHFGSRILMHEQGWLMAKSLPGRAAPRLTIGNLNVFGRFTKIVCAGEVTFGDEVLLADNVYIADTHYRFDDPVIPIGRQPLAEPKPIRIGSGAFIGRNSIVGPGVTIGDNAYVGAGTVITNNVPARCVIVGSPARILRHYDDAAGAWRQGPPPSHA